jgi:hypothetical protein
MMKQAGSIENDLSPLPPSELVRLGEGSVLHPVDETCIVPVPENMSNPATVHPRFGPPTGTWTYRGPGGEVLGHILRFDPPTGPIHSPAQSSSFL